MKLKKDIVITFRTDAQTKSQLDKMAEEKVWSVSRVIEKICKESFKGKDSEQKDRTIQNGPRSGERGPFF